MGFYKHICYPGRRQILNTLLMRKIGQEGAGTEVATDREEVRGVLAKLTGGGAVNFESLAAALPQDLRDPEVAQLRTSVLGYFQSAILRGQLDDLRGAGVLFERLEIQDVEFSPAYASTLENFRLTRHFWVGFSSVSGGSVGSR